MAFGKAFAAARKAGKKVFTYNGKKYTTKLAAETPNKVAVPPSRPSSEKRKAATGDTQKTAPKRKATKTPEVTTRTRSDVNDFKQSESRNSADTPPKKKKPGTIAKMLTGMDKHKGKSPGVLRGKYKLK